MACSRIGDKPLSEPTMTRFTDAYMRPYEEMSQVQISEDGIQMKCLFSQRFIALCFKTPVVNESPVLNMVRRQLHNCK